METIADVTAELMRLDPELEDVAEDDLRHIIRPLILGRYEAVDRATLGVMLEALYGWLEAGCPRDAGDWPAMETAAEGGGRR